MQIFEQKFKIYNNEWTLFIKVHVNLVINPESPKLLVSIYYVNILM